MTGLTLWANASSNTRALFIRLACDGDLQSSEVYAFALRRRLTIAQALEVTK